MFDKTMAAEVLDAALRTGGDYSELYMEDTEENRVEMVDGKVENSVYSRVSGAGVRVLKGAYCAYAYTSDVSPRALMETAKAAAAALDGVKKYDVRDIIISRDAPRGAKQPFCEVKNDKRVSALREATLAARGVSDEIVQVSANYLDVTQHVAIITSHGLYAQDVRPRGRIRIGAVAMKDGEMQTGGVAPGYGMGFEFLDKIDLKAIGREAANTAVTMLHAVPCPAGAVPVVIDGGFGGVILHEACVHSLEATSVAPGNSEFAGKLGTMIASPIVNAMDDGTMQGEWGSITVDDEGNPSQRNQLIENGKLISYLVDYRNSRTMGHPITGSSRRQGYMFAPTSRMTNTFFMPGTHEDEEMIRTMGEGLYAKKMGGGSVNPLTGDFNFAVLEGYWVKDGKIFCPVRGATLIGRGAEVLRRIDRIGKDMTMAPGMCGSASGSVPTNVGQPRIRVSEITVGGKGGKL